jgi:hypothetical protein
MFHREAGELMYWVIGVVKRVIKKSRDEDLRYCLLYLNKLFSRILLNSL